MNFFSSTSDAGDNSRLVSSKGRSYPAIIHFASGTGILLSLVLIPYAVMRRRLSLVQGELKQLTRNVETFHQKLNKLSPLAKEIEQSRRLLRDVRCETGSLQEGFSTMRVDILQLRSEAEKYTKNREEYRRLFDAVGPKIDTLQECSSTMENKIQAIGDTTDAVAERITAIHGRLDDSEKKMTGLEGEVNRLLDERRKQRNAPHAFDTSPVDMAGSKPSIEVDVRMIEDFEECRVRVISGQEEGCVIGRAYYIYE